MSRDKEILQSRLNILIDEIGYSLYELARELEKEAKTELLEDMDMAVGFLAIFHEKLENNKYDFKRSVEIWVEGKEEWNQAAWKEIQKEPKPLTHKVPSL